LIRKKDKRYAIEILLSPIYFIYSIISNTYETLIIFLKRDLLIGMVYISIQGMYAFVYILLKSVLIKERAIPF